MYEAHATSRMDLFLAVIENTGKISKYEVRSTEQVTREILKITAKVGPGRSGISALVAQQLSKGTQRAQRMHHKINPRAPQTHLENTLFPRRQ